MSVWKFMSSSTASGRNESISDISVTGEGMAFTSAKLAGSSISRAFLMPRLSSTTSILPLFIGAKLLISVKVHS